MSSRPTRGRARSLGCVVNLAVALACCAQGNVADDGAVVDAADAIAVANDRGVDVVVARVDAAVIDAARPAMDAASPVDAPRAPDAPDVVVRDAGALDVGSPDAGAPSVECGDGFIDRASGEVCDDGNRADDDACAADCRRVLCEDGSWRTIDPATARCYWRDTNVSVRDAAVTRCTARGGQLAVFETAAEAAVVYPAVGLSGGTSTAWIGLRRVGASWVWDNGMTLAFTGFRAGEPAGDGACVEWGPSNDFNDLPCDVRRDLLCERAPPGRPR